MKKLNCTGLEKHIDKYRNFCPHFFSESDREVGAYKEYCQPEKEVYYEVSNRSVQTLLGARYLQSTNTAAQQGDSDEATGNKERIAHIDEKGNDDTTEKVNAERDSSIDNETLIKYNTEDNSVKNASGIDTADHIRESGATEKGCITIQPRRR